MVERIRIQNSRDGRDRKRAARGRPQTHVFMTAAQMREWAARTGEMPHIFLLRIARGETIDGYQPKFQERIEAAKACAPFLVPRLGYMEISEAERDPRPREQLIFNEAELERLTSRELDLFKRMFSKLTGKAEPKHEPEVSRPNRYTQVLALSEDDDD